MNPAGKFGNVVAIVDGQHLRPVIGQNITGVLLPVVIIRSQVFDLAGSPAVGVGRREHQAMAEPLAERRLQRVVVDVGAVFVHGEGTEPRIRTHHRGVFRVTAGKRTRVRGGDRSVEVIACVSWRHELRQERRAQRHRIDVELDRLMALNVAHIGHFRHYVERQLPLYGN